MLGKTNDKKWNLGAFRELLLVGVYCCYVSYGPL